MSTALKPHSPASLRNREAILAGLQMYFADCKSVLEVGAGTGQHAVYFAAALPHLRWQASDLAENLAGIRLWLDEAQLSNTPPPIALAVEDGWPAERYDAVFSANTLHIMSWAQVRALFAALPMVMTETAVVAIYGPFNYGGRFTSDSNADFDGWLKQQGEHMGVRDFEKVDAMAHAIGLQLIEDRAMPANNRLLLWRYQKPAPEENVERTDRIPQAPRS